MVNPQDIEDAMDRIRCNPDNYTDGKLNDHAKDRIERLGSYYDDLFNKYCLVGE